MAVPEKMLARKYTADEMLEQAIVAALGAIVIIIAYIVDMLTADARLSGVQGGYYGGKHKRRGPGSSGDGKSGKKESAGAPNAPVMREIIVNGRLKSIVPGTAPELTDAALAASAGGADWKAAEGAPTATVYGGDEIGIPLVVDAMRDAGWNVVVAEEGGPRGTRKPVDVLWLSLGLAFRFNHDSYTHVARVKNVVVRDGYMIIADKVRLHAEMERQFAAGEIGERYWAESRPLAALKNVGNQMWILRPSGANFHSGNGIRRVRNDAELAAANKYYRENKWDHVVASHYFDDVYTLDPTPDLSAPVLETRKFHMRAYFMMRTARDGAVSYEIFPTFTLLDAKKPYVRANWEDDGIHDTHTDAVEFPMFLQENYERIVDPETGANFNVALRDSVIEQTGEIIRHLFEIVRDHGYCKPYEESRHGFIVFAIDFLIVRDGGWPRVVLIEANDKPGLSFGPIFGKVAGQAPDQARRQNAKKREYLAWVMRRGFHWWDATAAEDWARIEKTGRP